MAIKRMAIFCFNGASPRCGSTNIWLSVTICRWLCYINHKAFLPSLSLYPYRLESPVG